MKREYSAVAAKLKAIESTRLSEEDFDSLLSKASVFEVYSALAVHSGYREVLSGLSKEQAHRTELEKRLRHEMLREYGRVYSFMGLNQKRMFDYWFMRREIEFLKRGLSHLFNNESTEWLEAEDEFEDFFHRHTKLDCDAVRSAETLDKLIEACSRTPYADVLRRFQSIGGDYFTAAMMLDKAYYTGVWRAKEKYLDRRDRQLFAELIGAEIDMNNILWIYRGKKYFSMPPEVIVTLIPYRFRISEEIMKRLISAETAEQVVAAVRQTPYGELFDRLDEGFFPEENMNRIYCKRARHILENEPESMAAVYAYFDLKQTEIYNITTLIESIRYGLDKQAIKRHINL